MMVNPKPSSKHSKVYPHRSMMEKESYIGPGVFSIRKLGRRRGVQPPGAACRASGIRGAWESVEGYTLDPQ